MTGGSGAAVGGGDSSFTVGGCGRLPASAPTMESARAGAADGASLLERLDDMDAEELRATVHQLLREQKAGGTHPHSDTWASPPGAPVLIASARAESPKIWSRPMPRKKLAPWKTEISSCISGRLIG